MTVNRISLSVISFLQLILLPLFMTKLAISDWTWQLGSAVVMGVALSLMRTRWQLKWSVIAAGGFGVLACIGQWQLLPLVVAQIGLTAVITTQELNPQWAASVWTLIAVFVQLMLAFLASHTLVPTLIGLFVMIALPVILGIWADRLPLAVSAGLLVLIAVTGYLLQQFTLVMAAGVLVIGTLTSSRFVQARLSWYAACSLVLELIYLLTRLHG